MLSIRRFFAAGILFASLAGVTAASAQTSSGSVAEDSVPLLEAVITGPEDIAVGRTAVLDASSSRVTGESISYQWFLNDVRQPISQTVEAIYTPDRPGINTFRLVITSTVAGQQFRSESTHKIVAYNRKIVLIADASVETAKLQAHAASASEQGVYMPIIQTAPPAGPLGSEQSLAELLAERSNVLLGADAIILWTDGVQGLQALMGVVEESEELSAGIRNQSVVLITQRSLQTIARIARGFYSALNPDQIVITRKEAINPLLTTPDIDAFVNDVAQKDIDSLRVTSAASGLRPWNILSNLIDAMLTNGIPSDTVILLLVLPIIATILAFLKQVVGITTFGLYTPTIIALSFMALGWQIGIVSLLFIIAAGYGTRSLLSRWRMLYIPRVAIILSVVSFTLLILMGIGATFGVAFTRETVFLLLIMSTLSESFLNLKTEQGWTSAILGVVETVAAALLCVFIVQWASFQSLILAYPELILLTLPIDFLLGKWTGLRLVEYFRFREVFKHLQEE